MPGVPVVRGVGLASQDQQLPASSGPSSQHGPLPLPFDTSVPHPARRYNYWLGGKDNFAADRDSGDAIAAAFPTIRLWAQENRRFLGRAVRYLTGEVGVSQFLDIGTGIPAADNTHEVAQRINPASRVVYVDNDPIVLVHARALLTSAAHEGRIAYVDADLGEPDTILHDPALPATLDLTKPVALMMIAVLHFFRDEEKTQQIVRRLVGALPSGSYLVISHATHDHMPADLAGSAGHFDPHFTFRSQEQFGRFFEGLELVPPGITAIGQWHADDEPGPRPDIGEVAGYAAVARIP
jgi:S-adenosyl methyltransferase